MPERVLEVPLKHLLCMVLDMATYHPINIKVFLLEDSERVLLHPENHDPDQVGQITI